MKYRELFTLTFFEPKHFCNRILCHYLPLPLPPNHSHSPSPSPHTHTQIHAIDWFIGKRQVLIDGIFSCFCFSCLAWESRTLFDHPCSWKRENSLWWYGYDRQPNASASIIPKYTHRWTNINCNTVKHHINICGKQSYTTFTTTDQTNDSCTAQSWNRIRISKPSWQASVISYCIVWPK